MNTSLRIAYCCSNPTYRLDAASGYSTHIRELSSALREVGCSVSVFLPSTLNPVSSPAPTPRPHPLRLFVPRLLWEALKDLIRIRSNLRFGQEVAKRLESDPVDLIYERVDFAGGALWRWAKENEVPYIIEIHSPLDKEIEELAGRRPLRSAFHQNVVRTIQNATCAIGVSTVLKSWLLQNGMAENRIHVLQNAVDLNTFSPQTYAGLQPKYRRRSDAVVVGFVGSDLQWYGIRTLVEAFASARRSTPMTLMIVGITSQNLEIRRLVEMLHLTDAVIFTGPIPHIDVPRAIAEMDICVLPNTKPYMSPIKIFEYGAMGKAVVAPRTIPIQEVIRDKIDGILLDSESAEETAKVLVALARDSTQRTQMGESLKSRITERFTWPKASQALADVFRNTLSGPRA